MTWMGHNSLFEKHHFRQLSLFTLVKLYRSAFLDNLGLQVIVSLSAYFVCFCVELLPWVAEGMCFLMGVCGCGNMDVGDWGGHVGTGFAPTVVKRAVSLVSGYKEKIEYLSASGSSEPSWVTSYTHTPTPTPYPFQLTPQASGNELMRSGYHLGCFRV